MRGCVIGGVVLAVVLALVVGNAIYVRGTVEELTALVEALPEEPDPTSTPTRVGDLRAILESKEAILELSVNYATVDRAVEALRTLESAAAVGDTLQYRETLAVLGDLMEDIGRLERLSVKNLL